MRLPYVYLSLFFLFLAQRAQAAHCQGEVASGNLDGYYVQHTTDGGCSLYITPVVQGNSHRSFSLSDTGLVQVTNKYQDSTGDDRVAMSTRTYYMFPRAGLLSIQQDSDGQVDVRTAAGALIRFSPGDKASGALPKIVKLSDAQVSFVEADLISKKNAGSVEIVQKKGSRSLVLDCGFAVGPKIGPKYPDYNSIFRDGQGGHCAVPNHELFSYAHYAAIFKFETDRKLAEFLRTKPQCKDLDLSALEKPAIMKQGKGQEDSAASPH